MKCVKCKKEIPQESVYCMFCGCKQEKPPKKKTRSHKGTGSVSLVNGRYQARLTINGKRKSLGYYNTKAEALNAIRQADIERMSASRYDYTLEDLYNEWSQRHYETISHSAELSYKAAWKYMPHQRYKGKRYKDITFSRMY